MIRPPGDAAWSFVIRQFASRRSPSSAEPGTVPVWGPLAHRGFVARPSSDWLSGDELVTLAGNRWSRPGEPTIYLGSHAAVALAEFARHLEPDTSPLGRMWTVDVRLDLVVDLRDLVDPRSPDARNCLGVPEDPLWILDRARCRSVAAEFRAGGAQGLVVPSVAFLDQPERWNLVVFADRLESDERSIGKPRFDAALESR